jgi:hypothetical protein
MSILEINEHHMKIFVDLSKKMIKCNKELNNLMNGAK